MKSLYTKLSVTFMLLVMLIGAALMLLGYSTMRSYYEEITQELNKSIAMYISDNYYLSQESGNDEVLRQLSNHAMTINPTAEVYLLDTNGTITNQINMPDDEIKQRKIPLEPIQSFLKGSTRFPLRGNDPRSLGEKKIFSASKIYDGKVLKGYLYVILGGKIHDNIANTIRSSYVLQTGFWSILVILLSAILVGLWFFKSLTARLNTLTTSVNIFTNSHYQTNHIQRIEQNKKDEIGLLHHSFNLMADKIHEQFTRLNKADQLRRELISNVSHDLRTPLATTQGYIETLLIKNDVLDTESRKKYLTISQRSTQHLSQLIDDLFELSKLEAGKIELNCESFPLMELIYDTTQEFELEAKRKGVSIYMPPPNQNLHVHADIGLIQRVLANLIKNALKFTPKGGSISVGFTVNDNTVEVVVKDTGIGINPEHLPHIFDRHYCINETRDNSSNGLGLAIVKRILELHNSTISVTSRINQGSYFQFNLLRDCNKVCAIA